MGGDSTWSISLVEGIRRGPLFRRKFLQNPQDSLTVKLEPPSPWSSFFSTIHGFQAGWFRSKNSVALGAMQAGFGPPLFLSELQRQAKSPATRARPKGATARSAHDYTERASFSLRLRDQNQLLPLLSLHGFLARCEFQLAGNQAQEIRRGSLLRQG